MTRDRARLRAALAAVLLAIAATLVFVPLASGSASSLVGCILGRDLVVRHDQGGNARYDNGRGPDCSDWSVIGKRSAVVVVVVASGLSLIRSQRA